jgi:cell fate (sporulation/competence/biofilm development) regulator YlbF (YheA/YmcA/DUF963 family)
MKQELTFDEGNLLAIYSAEAKTRQQAIAALEEVAQYLEADEMELRSLCQDVLDKLHAMTDEDYLTLDLSPII